MPRSAAEILIRPALATDAGTLAEIRTTAIARAGNSSEVSTRLTDEEVDFLDRLSIPHGQDYFCFVAARGSEIVGYVIGGGSRDLDRKAHGEVYELAVDPAAGNETAAEQLLATAIAAFDEAAFAGTLFSFSTNDKASRTLASAAGMRCLGDHPTVAGHVRFERPLQSGGDR